MKRLILMRHAKTETWTEGLDDFGRALTDRGHEDAARMAQELVDMGWSPERILVSTARRARETCSDVARIFVDEGPTMKRFHARARGKASRIVKPFSRIRIVVREHEEAEEA